MKKLIVAVAAVALTAGIAAAAPDKNKKQCKQPQQCEKQCNQPCDSACNRPCPPAYCPFDNLNLTDAQKQQIKDLRTKHQADRQAKKADKKAAKAERKADRQAAKKARLEEIKVILTPEQYVQYLENLYLNGDRAPQINKAKGQAPAKKHGPMKQGPARPAGQHRPQPQN